MLTTHGRLGKSVGYLAISWFRVCSLWSRLVRSVCVVYSCYLMGYQERDPIIVKSKESEKSVIEVNLLKSLKIS